MIDRRHVFHCIDGHTAGNPVRLVISGAPPVRGATMAERRKDFRERFDWIRKSLCFEPRGHDLMSGGFLYPPARDDADVGVLFIETSGSLPMCGHGLIGIMTFGLEHGLIHPQTEGIARVETPAGLVGAAYVADNGRVSSVRFTNVASYLAKRDVEINVPDFGRLSVDIAYGGNFYAIIEPQGPYEGLDALGAGRLVELSRTIRRIVREKIEPVHPVEPSIRGVTHVLWADAPKGGGADARNAVFYGERAIDRSPCGTGTSARMAQLAAKGQLKKRDRFVHESYIGSRFIGVVEETMRLGDYDAITPSIEGSAIATGFNTIWVDPADPFWRGFHVD
ncbi:MAG: 4-hydroxyproline epimerase [Parvularculaceae bacterium]